MKTATLILTEIQTLKIYKKWLRLWRAMSFEASANVYIDVGKGNATGRFIL